MGGISGLISLLCMVAVSSLNIGDAAPSLEGTKWLKGNAPAKNQITVVEIWRTSCGNCKAQIPHLTALQKKYGDRISIVAVTKDSTEVIEEFLKTNGDQMDYSVGYVTKTIIDPYATDISGVPYAYLINKNGQVIWKGHPKAIDDILASTVEGNVDIDQLKQVDNLETSLDAALKTNDAETIAPIDEKLLLLDPANEEGLEVAIMLAKYNEKPTMVREIFDKVPWEGLSAYKSNLFAAMLISEDDLSYRYPEAALRFSSYAVKKEPKNPVYIDLFARILYTLGDLDKAIQWERTAINLKPDENSYRTNLNYYLSLKAIRTKADYKDMPQS